MAEKQMDPYTEAEYKEQKDPTHEQFRGTPGSIWDRFNSVSTIISAFKKFPEAWKYRMEQGEKFESARLYERLATNLIP